MGELVVSCGDAPKILQSAEHALDRVAFLIGAGVERMEALPVGFVGNDRQGALSEKKGTQVIGIVGSVGGERSCCWNSLQEAWEHFDVGGLASAQGKDEGTASRIAQSMDLSRSPAARSADGLQPLPPFWAPAAAR